MVKFTALMFAYVFGFGAIGCATRSEISESIGARVCWGAGAITLAFLTLFSFVVVTFAE